MTSGPALRRAIALAIATNAALFSLAARADESGAGAPQRADDATTSAGSATPAEAKQAWTWPITLDVSAFLGGSIRLGQAPSLTITDRTGFLAGGGIVAAPSRFFSIGLMYEHLDLGAERLGNSGVQSASVERAAHALWADLRVYPVRTQSLSVFGGIGIGLAWQRADASGLIEVQQSGGAARSFQIFRCSASAAANPGLRGNVGVEVPILGRLLFVTDASFENVRLSGEVLDNCISGAGTTSVFALRAGLASRFDLTSLFR